jgi:hypothetical protein
MVTPTGNLEKRLAELKKQVPVRGIERHPSLLSSLSDLPAELLSPALTALSRSQVIQTIIAFPPQIQHGWHYVPKQALVFTPGGVIHILASIWPGQEPELSPVDIKGILYTRVTLLLLYGFLEVVARGSDSPTRLGLEFNTVAWGQLAEPFDRLLAAIANAAAPAGRGAPSAAAQEALEGLPMKFANGVRLFALLPSERLEGLAFQPGLWRIQKVWPFSFRKPVTASTLICLTSHFVVLIQEELGVAQGWIVSYIVRDSIVAIQNQPRLLFNELVFRMQRGDQTATFTLPLGAAATQTWRREWMGHGGHWDDPPDEAGNGAQERRSHE